MSFLFFPTFNSELSTRIKAKTVLEKSTRIYRDSTVLGIIRAHTPFLHPVCTLRMEYEHDAGNEEEEKVFTSL